MTDLFDERLRRAARSIPSPDAPRDLMARVLAERAAGKRVALPIDEMKASRRRLWRGYLVAAASLAAAAFVFTWKASSKSATTDVSSEGLFTATAYAGQIQRTLIAPPLVPDGSGILAKTYRYRLDYIDSGGRVTPDGTGSLVISPAIHTDGTPAWRVELSSDQTFPDGQRRQTVETLLVSQRTLQPFTRVVQQTPYHRYSEIRIVQRFHADSVTGEMTTDGGVRRPFARRLPVEIGPVLTDAMAPFTLVGQRLHAGQTASMSIVGWAVVPTDVSFPVRLHVVGEESITTASGVFDCWKVDVGAGTEHRIEWVRKSDGLGIRSYDTRASAKGHWQFELINP